MLDAADSLLAEEGATALSTTRVAEQAGVSVGSLYQYLPDKAAIIQALAGRYLAEFESLMADFVEAARAGDGDWQDPAGVLIDGFARRYRERPGYRALWFGRELTAELRAADRENKLALAEGVRQIVLALGLADDSPYLGLVARTGVLVADSLLQEAFRADPDGDDGLINEAKTILRLYLADILARLRSGEDARRDIDGRSKPTALDEH